MLEKDGYILIDSDIANFRIKLFYGNIFWLLIKIQVISLHICILLYKIIKFW